MGIHMVYAWLCVGVWVYVCGHIGLCVCVCMGVCVHLCISTCVHHVWHTCICVCVSVHAYMCVCISNYLYIYRRQGKFAGLNIHSFSVIKVFTEILACYLGHECSFFSTIKERHLYSWKNFHGTSEIREKCKSLAQRIFPCLWYTYVHCFTVILCSII